MKGTITTNLNIRIGSPSTDAPTFNFLRRGMEIEIVELVQGTSLEGNDTWYKCDDGTYMWSGGVLLHSQIAEPGNVAPATGKTSFDWFKQLGIEQAWNKYQVWGEQTTVAVLDTGYVTKIKDLSAGVVSSAIFVPDEPDIEDQSNYSHGTHCMSLIGARNTMQWLVGVAPKCKLLAGKISINEETNMDAIIAGIKWSIDKGADIISVSYSLDIKTETEVQQYQDQLQTILQGKKVIVFASAGNNFRPGFKTGERYPASFSGCVSVGATDLNGKLSDVTIRSDRTILHAPGVDIESYGRNGIPEKKTGTSFSTPIVAAVAALGVSYCKQKYGTWDAAKILKTISDTATALPGFPNKKILNPQSFLNSL